MGIGGEEDGKVSCGHDELCRRFVGIELHVFAFVIFLCYFLAVHLGFPAHGLVVGQRNLDINVVFVCFHAAVLLCFAFEV